MLLCNHTANHSFTVAVVSTGTLLFAPKSLGANHPLAPAATFETANRCSSLCCRQVFKLIPARCRWLWLFGESQSSRGPSLIVYGILIRCSKTWGGVSVECPPAAVLGEATYVFFLCLFVFLGSHPMPSSLKRKRKKIRTRNVQIQNTDKTELWVCFLLDSFFFFLSELFVFHMQFRIE